MRMRTLWHASLALPAACPGDTWQALGMLMYMVRSGRLMLIPLANVLCSLMLSLGLMYPVSLAIDVQTITPTMMVRATI